MVTEYKGEQLIKIPGPPKGKARPKVFNGHAVTPKGTVDYENWVKICYQEQSGVFLEGALKATIMVFYDIPKSYSKKRTEACLNNLELPVKKPDIDNIAKIILDSLNGIAYKDDSQITSLVVNKYYGKEPMVILKLEQL